jgi:hypothetical protein
MSTTFQRNQAAKVKMLAANGDIALGEAEDALFQDTAVRAQLFDLAVSEKPDLVDGGAYAHSLPGAGAPPTIPRTDPPHRSSVFRRRDRIVTLV